jgi:hypothetical protein
MSDLQVNPVDANSRKRATRRALLSLGSAAAAGAVVGALLPSAEAEAHPAGGHFDSANNDPALHGNNTAGGPGVLGTSVNGPAIAGHTASPSNAAIVGNWTGTPGPNGHSGVFGSSSGNAPGVHGTAPVGLGVLGSARTLDAAGTLTNGVGVKGESGGGVAVLATSISGPGVRATSETANAINAASARRRRLGHFWSKPGLARRVH